jgi:cephalosporin hydroxylase
MRALESDLPREMIPALQRGVMHSKYRGIGCLKSPFDMVIYLQLFSRQVPRSIFEIGTRFGGSALWFADMMQSHGVDGSVVTVDISPPEGFEDPRIRMLKGNASALGETLSPELLGAPHPWLVIDDSSHMYEDSLAVLRFFHPHLQPGDYIVIEDGVVAFMDPEKYGKYQSGPTRAVEDFLADHESEYELDTSLCDHFGRNVTYNPNGWLKKL